ncbi:hypothetical protein F0562_010063 [Nyssa sinensis]|uniref:Uncharacterized protein n=1 Tax=Nyssa sinensis TaxID=561372 RepID=A0A5J4ZZI2_9ASTE|nr:hypothetical protein F0562_010063 [Nyssa sinensis]
MGSHLLHLYISSRASLINRLAAYFPKPIMRYYSESRKENNGHIGVEERAPSTAEEFERVAEEKARQGIVSQTVEKAYDGAEEATLGDSKVESVQERHKEPVGKGNFPKTCDD